MNNSDQHNLATDKRNSNGNPSKKRILLTELYDFVVHGKRWWLIPILLVLGFLATFALLAGVAPVMPFIYTLF